MALGVKGDALRPAEELARQRQVLASGGVEAGGSCGYGAGHEEKDEDNQGDCGLEETAHAAPHASLACFASSWIDLGFLG